ncbi:MAG: exosortase-associated EpsI family protein [Verrucomicrobiota bacterium]
MKKILLVVAFAILAASLGLRAYFVFTLPPTATLQDQLSDLFPSELKGWKVRDMKMSNSPEAAARVSDFLKFDDSLFRVFQKSDTIVSLYIAYWTPGKASYRWAGAHTPDTCWVQNGWTRLDREYGIPFNSASADFQPAEFGIFEKNGNVENVYFWHLVGGVAFGYDQKGGHNIFGALIDIQKHGLNLRQEQFFIRLSSNKMIEELKGMEGFQTLLDGLAEIGLEKPGSLPEN